MSNEKTITNKTNMNNTDDFAKMGNEEKLVLAKKGLEINGFVVYICQDKQEACNCVSELIKDHEMVRDGGSQTLVETNVISVLAKRDIDYFSHNDASISKEDKAIAMQKAGQADTFLASTNALTLDGELINVDGNGNRVAAMIYGPKQVIIVAGVNKIVENEDEAIKRIRNVAALKNALRLNKNTPCVIKKTCLNCKSKDRICCSYVKINFQKDDRIKIILINEEYGY